MTPDSIEAKKVTPLLNIHKEQGGKIVDFSGWLMPLHYGSQIEEHHSVRQKAGIFDVSHMTVIDVEGPEAKKYLQWLLANDVSKLTCIGSALYSGMLNSEGGVVDDLIVYFIADNKYRVIVNCATREKDFLWMGKQADGFNVTLSPQPHLAIIAIQGPKAMSLLMQTLGQKESDSLSDLKPFQSVMMKDCLYARTGYTGEDGFEVIMPSRTASDFWISLCNLGAKPCGLGARDTLRLEAGLNLYGAEMDESINPLAANMGWCIAWKPENRSFCGREAVEHERILCKEKLVGLVLNERGVLRGGQTVCLSDGQKGVVTSGTFSPTLNQSIALARVPSNTNVDSALVEIRGRQLPVTVGSPKFIRLGKVVFKAMGV